MSKPRGSRYILGHLSYSDLATTLQEGQQAVLVLNPDEPKARHEVSKNVKAAFMKAGRYCELESKRILVESDAPGLWQESHFLYVTAYLVRPSSGQ
ncbi:hypothetical protein NPS53_08940 [Pseudomonas putida]|uniref:hypothetical protein n=1 Tax=Pseudomonas putida TaxID=303 RepID=UPI0023643946|nr:hypothetical protein [Pseudomonas putida]MDD2139700.1 hypothetical protein [Pseudomonas putida]HDS1721624.1 hypothetical protein [Pseudomonas putida]